MINRGEKERKREKNVRKPRGERKGKSKTEWEEIKRKRRKKRENSVKKLKRKQTKKQSEKVIKREKGKQTPQSETEITREIFHLHTLKNNWIVSFFWMWSESILATKNSFLFFKFQLILIKWVINRKRLLLADNCRQWAQEIFDRASVTKMQQIREAKLHETLNNFN